MPAERVLTAGELNRAVLARQHLLERAAGPLPRVLERVGCIQAQYAPSAYVGLWSRVAGLRRDDVTAALERRAIVQATLMRQTIHLCSRRDYWPLAVGTARARRQEWLRARRGDPPEAAMEEAAARLRSRLGTGPLRRAEAEEAVGRGWMAGIGAWVHMVRVPPSGTWERRRADLFAAAEAWVGACDASEEAGIDLLVRRYLRAFGPASRADVAGWAGLKVGAIAPALERMDLRRFRAEGGGELLDLPGGPLPPADAPAPVRLLGTWDATLLVHARRSGVLPEEHRPRVFSVRTPHSVCTFLVDGRVAGTWRHDGRRVELAPFGRLDAAAGRELRAEAERLEAFYA